MRKLTPFFAAAILLNTQCSRATSGADSHISTQSASVPSTSPHVELKGKSPSPHSSVERVNLPQLSREALAVHFHESSFATLEELIKATPVCDEYKHPAGLFVTLSRQGQTRACWGSVNPTNQDLVRATVYTTEEALSREYRYRPVSASEWKFLKPQVTIVRSVEPIASIDQQNAIKYGLLAQYEGRGAILLPGEVVDAHCQLLKCKLKAGIPVNQPCQLYRIRADVRK